MAETQRPEQEHDRDSFVGARYRRPSLYSAGRAEKVQVYAIDNWIEITSVYGNGQLYLELELVPFAKRLYVRINRTFLLDLTRFSRLESAEEIFETDCSPLVCAEFEDGHCSCSGDLAVATQKQEKCRKHLFIQDCNMDMFVRGLSHMSEQLDAHVNSLQSEVDRIVDSYHRKKVWYPPMHSPMQLPPLSVQRFPTVPVQSKRNPYDAPPQLHRPQLAKSPASEPSPGREKLTNDESDIQISLGKKPKKSKNSKRASSSSLWKKFRNSANETLDVAKDNEVGVGAAQESINL